MRLYFTSCYLLLWNNFTHFLENTYLHVCLNKKIYKKKKNLLPKKDKDLRFLKNWHLLNTDYKILTKALAQKLQNVIGQIVNRDQIGYIKGRFYW